MKVTFRLYEVGGKVRDELLGLKSKDVDYSVVLSSTDNWTAQEGFDWFEAQLVKGGYEIFLATPECYTIRAKFPKEHKYSGVADFVLARHETGYFDGTRRPVVTLGTLEEDMLRRDFTVNALARDEFGGITDYFNGREDLKYRILQTPGDPAKSFQDDPLRIIRGIRFCITKGFTFSREVRLAIREHGIHGLEVVSQERIREELYKCFKYDTVKTWKYLNFMENHLNFPIIEYAFRDTGLWLEPTNKL